MRPKSSRPTSLHPGYCDLYAVNIPDNRVSSLSKVYCDSPRLLSAVNNFGDVGVA